MKITFISNLFLYFSTFFLDSVNTHFVRSIERTPYEVVFGQPPNNLLKDILESSEGIEVKDVQNVLEETKSINEADDINFETIVDHDKSSFLYHQPPSSTTTTTPETSVTEEPPIITTTLPTADATTMPPAEVATQSYPTSPRRKYLREETMSKLHKNANFLTIKYSKSKRIKVQDFKVNDNVSVKIPKEDRFSTDMLRLPGIVINKSNGKQPTYQILTSYGVLKKRYTSSHLIPYHGIVAN